MKIVTTRKDVTPELLALAAETVEWFEDQPTMPTEDFLDRLFKHPTRWDLEDYDNDAARAIMQHARRVRREQRA